MKQLKGCLLAICLLAVSIPCTAQKLDFKWGATAGLVFTNYEPTYLAESISDKAGWQIGVMASLDWGRLSIEPQLLYAHHAFSYDGVHHIGGTQYKKDHDTKLHSIDLPLLIGLRVVGPVRIFAGPLATLYQKASMTEGGYDKKGVRPDFSYVVGLEARVLKHIRIDARYNGCFDDRSGIDKTNIFSINVGYLF